MIVINFCVYLIINMILDFEITNFEISEKKQKDKQILQIVKDNAKYFQYIL